MKRLALTLLATLGCSELPRQTDQANFTSGTIKTPPVIDRALTYHQDVKPIVDARCATCHVEGGVGPGAMTTYEQVRDQSGTIRIQVAERRMPPFIGLSECNEYADDWSLTDEQRGIITTWIDQGTPEGDPATPGAAIEKVQPTISRVDLDLKMPEPYTPKENADDYRCIVIDWPERAPAFVTGFGVTPGHIDEVHHVLAFSIPPEQAAVVQAMDVAEPGPGYTCFGGPGVERSRTELIGSWVPGIGSGDLPPGTGILVLPGSKIVMQMHYNTTGAYALHGKPAPDQSSMQIKIDAQVAKPATTMPVVNPAWLIKPEAMLIPAGEADVIHGYGFDPTILSGGLPIEIHRAVLHQHVLGERSRLSVKKLDQTEQCLVDIPRWDFHWQSNYELKNPVKMFPGDLLRIDCEWDNSAAKQPIVDGQRLSPVDVSWGEGTRDEMCLGGVLVTY